MQRASIAVAGILSVAGMFGQEPVVARSNIWVDTVRRGDMPVVVRGRGVLGANKTAELKMPEDLIKQVQPGQTAAVDTGQGVIDGKVARVGPAEVVVELEGALPVSARPGLAVDGTIHMTALKDVAHVGRPVFCRLNGEATIFKLEKDGQHATRVKVEYGKGSVNRVEVRNGLVAGDQVILSDMSAYDGKDRVRLE
jgi:HlyD family secretion protein